MLGRPVLGRLGAATASALLVALALVIAFSRSPGTGADDSRSNAAGQAAVDPAPASTEQSPETGPGSGSPSASPASAGSEPETRPEQKAGPGRPAPVHPAWVPPSIIDDFGPATSPGFYDFREDALRVGGTSMVVHTLPSEVTDPPGSIVDPPPPPVVADDLEVNEVGPYSAVVSFTTDQDVAGVVGFGLDEPVDFASDPVGRQHRIELVGLIPDTDYDVEVLSHTSDDKPELSFETDSRPFAPEASTNDGKVELDGAPFFPVTAYGACPPTFQNLLDAGVNVFQWEHSCGAEERHVLDSIDTLEDRAYWTVPWGERKLASDGLIGYTQPDEPDGLGLDPSGLSDIEEPGRVTFLTLTQHFAPGTGEFPWQYPGYYEGLAQKADVLGVDFYPLQSLCSPEKLALNHDVQVELVKLAEGKPTLQWIEAAEMKCPERLDAAITAETIRAEMLLAIAGGANGLGIFPARIDLSAAFAIRSTLDLIEQAWPMLLTPRLPVEIGGEGAPLVRASARESAGATTLVVVNASTNESASVELRLDGLTDERQFESIDDSLELVPEGGVLHLELDPLEAHILVAEPDPLATPSDTGDDD